MINATATPSFFFLVSVTIILREYIKDLIFVILEQTQIPIILLLNVGAPIELTDILQEAGNIKAVLNISLPGQEGGCAAADVLFGRVTPSGRLTATWARRYNEYPCAENFGYLNRNLETEYYKEGIYVGYRYFSSFGIKPLFPFGFGLSYTTFSIKFEGLQINKSSIDITVSVKNTGNNYFGRQVVQVYVSPPQTGSVKEYQRLIGFGKTENLKPQESQELVISIEQSYLASITKIKSLIYSRRIIVTDTRKKNDGVAVAFITRRGPLAGGCLMMYG